MPVGRRRPRKAAQCPAPAGSAGRAAASREGNDCFYPASVRTQDSSRVFREFAGVLRLIISQQSAVSSQQSAERFNRKVRNGRKGSQKVQASVSCVSVRLSFGRLLSTDC